MNCIYKVVSQAVSDNAIPSGEFVGVGIDLEDGQHRFPSGFDEG